MPAIAPKEKTVDPAIKTWRMPQPTGGVVVWNAYERGRRAIVNDCMAIVTRVSERSIDVVIFPPGGGGAIQKFGVRHCEDPGLSSITVPSPGGVFDLTPLEKLVRQLASDVGG